MATASKDQPGCRLGVDSLPDVVLEGIFAQLSTKDRVRHVPLVCRSWRDVAHNGNCAMWHSMWLSGYYGEHTDKHAQKEIALALWCEARRPAVAQLCMDGLWRPELFAYVFTILADSLVSLEVHLRPDPYGIGSRLSMATLGVLTRLESLTYLTGDAPAGPMHLAEHVLPVCNLTRLTSLVLGKRVVEIPADISRLQALTRLEVHLGGDVHVLPAELGALTGLLHLRLEGNSTVVRSLAVPDTLSALTRLTLLALEHVAVRDMPPGVACMHQLRKLDLSWNYSLNGDSLDGLSRLRKLSSLALVHCGLEELPGGVLPLAWLQELRLAENKLTGLPLGPYLGDLRKLDLALNDVGYVPAQLSRALNLQVLDLTANGRLQLDEATVDVLGELPRLEVLAVNKFGTDRYWSEVSIEALESLAGVFACREPPYPATRLLVLERDAYAAERLLG